MFDDVPNLSVLGNQGTIDSLNKLKVYLNSGFAGPTKRPVSMASFLIDAQSWPADPFSFKKTNVLIHLLNCCLLAWFAYLLLSLVTVDKTCSAAVLALVCAAVWLLHPLWVSSVLYVIQRMATLATTFSLAALITFLKLRCVDSKDGFSLKALCYAFLCVILSILAVFSKESAAVLPFLFLSVDVVLQAANRNSRRSWMLVRCLLTLGCFFVIGYLLYRGVPAWSLESSRRDFTVGERFWTEGRVLWMYIYDLLIPKAYSSGLFVEISASKGAFSPLGGLFGWLAILGICLLVYVLRKRLPFLAIGVLGYFSGHLIESTVIPLELYFEHRNYLPGAMLSVCLLELFTRIRKKTVLAALFGLCISIESLLLFIRVDMWGTYSTLVKSWALHDVSSLRSQLEASRASYEEGDLSKTYKYLSNALLYHPQSGEAWLWKIILDCSLSKKISDVDLTNAITSLEDAKESGTLLRYFETIVSISDYEQCKGLDVVGLIDAYQSANAIKGSKTYSRLDVLAGQYFLSRGDVANSVNRFDRAVLKLRSINTGLLSVAMLASGGFRSEALELLIKYEKMYTLKELWGSDFDYQMEIDGLKAKIQEDLN
ncbi:hypothetical protein EUZ85_09245 [Hahella sp. KA22]|uniref:hypothetical protein n=1 Tax=Hahella sp. KA22 TaxID=1628392 RepID=UPI000FDE4371|nr:hypothetical protein [Hahella sp. KA22]AZZ90895.1 hypothetical protein ENC22_06690 [Hahella sp. KA22]QAY54265.1 hypothetical protein EUZ85_09245 [Hahella sp. KA22]